MSPRPKENDMHTIAAPRSNLTHAVLSMDGYPVSWHASQQAAEKAAHRATRRFLRSQHGGSTAYLPLSIIPVHTGNARVERVSPASTRWQISK
jgi:hypothetical protein